LCDSIIDIRLKLYWIGGHDIKVVCTWWTKLVCTEQVKQHLL